MEFQLLQCWHAGCTQTFYTFTEASNHHLAMHEVPLTVGAREPWTPKVRLTPWQPVLRGTIAGVIITANGSTPPEQGDGQEPPHG